MLLGYEVEHPPPPRPQKDKRQEICCPFSFDSFMLIHYLILNCELRGLDSCFPVPHVTNSLS